MEIVPLDLLKSGEEGRICDFSGAQDVVKHLCEMGLRHGARVRMVQPGSPCIVSIDDHRRYNFRSEAEVLVEIQRN